MAYQLEIACFNLESAILAAKAGADRIELCDEIKAGGTTPDFETVKEARRKISTPIFVMIRPKGGNFTYSEAEFETMKNQIMGFKALGIDGFVFGILKPDNSIDIKKNSELVKLTSPLPCTFHRAFDRTNDCLRSLEQAIECGFKTILTSGLKDNVNDGSDNLKALVIKAGKRINIMPGGGLRSMNMSEIMRKTKAKFYHSSAITNNSEIADSKEIIALKNCLLKNE